MPISQSKLFLGAVTCLLIAGGAFYLFYVTNRNYSRYKSWPLTTATLLSSAIERKTVGKSSGRTGPNTLRPGWTVAVTYRYTVDGITYEGDRLSNRPYTETAANASAEASEELKAIAAHYVPGQKIPAYYDPEDHSRSFLEVRPPSGRSVPAIIGVFFLALGVILVAAGMRQG